MSSRPRVSSIGFCTLVVGLCLLAFGSVTAHKNVELTAAAETVLQRLFPTASVVDVGHEHERGVELYEVVLRDGDRKMEVEITPEGLLGEIESEVAMSDLPFAVRDRIDRHADGMDGSAVERHEVHGVTEHGRLIEVDPPRVYYEVVYQDGGTRREIAVGSDGEILSAEEDDSSDSWDDDSDSSGDSDDSWSDDGDTWSGDSDSSDKSDDSWSEDSDSSDPSDDSGYKDSDSSDSDS